MSPNSVCLSFYNILILLNIYELFKNYSRIVTSGASLPGYQQDDIDAGLLCFGADANDC